MENTPVPPADEQEKPVTEQKPGDKKPKRKKKRHVGRTILKIIIWIVVVVAVIFLTLFLTSRIAEFDTIMDMLEYIRDQLS